MGDVEQRPMEDFTKRLRDNITDAARAHLSDMVKWSGRAKHASQYPCEPFWASFDQFIKCIENGDGGEIGFLVYL